MPQTKTRVKPVKDNISSKPKRSSQPVVDRADMSPSEPIPFEGGKAFSYVNQQHYLPFLSPDDNYGQLLLESRLLSDTHNACVITKKDYCAGSGFQAKDDTKLDPKLIEWLSNVNLNSDPATEVSKQEFENFFTFGNAPIELVRLTVAGKKYFYIYPRNPLEWRLCEPDEDDIVQEAIYSKLFLRQGILSSDDYKKSKKLPLYNPRKKDTDNWKKFPNGTERTLIWYKHAMAGFPHYGLPSAVSSMIYQILEYKGARYNLDNLDNNLVVGAILALKGSISQGEADRIGKKAVKTYTGDGKRGRLMVVASEEGIDGSDLHNMETYKEGSYQKSDEIWTQKIILANQWDAVLAGILSPNTLGKGSGFITKILEIKQNTVIRPAQEDLMTKVWKPILIEASKWIGFKADPDNIEIRNSIDISGLTDVDITPAVKVNEVRKAKGLPGDPSPKGEMYLGELNQKQKGVKNEEGDDPNVDPNKGRKNPADV